MFIDKVCVLHRQSKWCYFANEVHILFLPIMPVNKKPVKLFTIYLTGLSLSLYFNFIQQQLLPLCQQNLPELLQIQ